MPTRQLQPSEFRPQKSVVKRDPRMHVLIVKYLLFVFDRILGCEFYSYKRHNQFFFFLIFLKKCNAIYFYGPHFSILKNKFRPNSHLHPEALSSLNPSGHHHQFIISHNSKRRHPPFERTSGIIQLIRGIHRLNRKILNGQRLTRRPRSNSHV